jgi:hypothetical protein
MEFKKALSAKSAAFFDDAIAVAERELAPFFEKYPKISSVVLTNYNRGNDEGFDWLQFQFEVAINDEMQDYCDMYDEDEEIYISDVIYDIPLKLSDMVNIFGTEEVEFVNNNVKQ